MIESKKELSLEEMDGIIQIESQAEEVIRTYFVKEDKVYDTLGGVREVGYVKNGMAYIGGSPCLSRIKPFGRSHDN